MSAAVSSGGRLRRSTSTLLAVLVFAAATVVLGGLAAGWRPIAIRGGSMQPTIALGDLVLARTVQAADVRAGDVVTFRRQAPHDDLVTHRVVALERAGDRMTVTTKGDANEASETWTVLASSQLGRAAVVVPELGRVLLAPRPSYAVAAVLGLTALVAAPFARRLFSAVDDDDVAAGPGGSPA